MNKEANKALLADLYQFTMMYGYYKTGTHEVESVFDLFYRRQPGESAYCIMAGLEQVIEYIQNIRFEEEEIAYLRSLHLFDEDFLNYLRAFQFTGELYAMPEGSVIFPQEPIVRVRTTIFQAQLIETALLNMINHQTLIATKASNIVYAADGDPIMEFGARRAQGVDAALYGARAAVIGGAASTSDVLAGAMFGIPVSGTHAHSWVLSFPNEIDAFRAYAETFPTKCVLLVDTYDTLKSGVPNAIRVFQELADKGYRPEGIRLDSGDIAYLSKEARRMLDQAGFQDVKITASNDLDEVLIRDLKAQGACVDVWGVGTKLITGGETPALGGVYKLAAKRIDGAWVPKMKLSDNIAKVTLPGYKKVVRLYDRKTKKALADLILLDDETIDDTKPLRIYHPQQSWKSMVLHDFYATELLVPIFQQGKLVYQCPSLDEIVEHMKQEVDTLWDEYKRPINPQEYKVDISDALYDMRKTLLDAIHKE